MTATDRGQQLQERRIILASASPRRRDLLANLGFHPVVRPAQIEEVRRPEEPPDAYTLRLSRAKAAAIADNLDERQLTSCNHAVLAADTVVVADGEVLEKPADPGEARTMLTTLSDRWHQVITGYCVHPIPEPSAVRLRAVSARVRFKRLSQAEITRYVSTGEPMDKAGAYGIQGIGAFLVQSIEGSYHTVVGLPLCEVIEDLLAVGALSGFPFPRGEEVH